MNCLELKECKLNIINEIVLRIVPNAIKSNDSDIPTYYYMDKKLISYEYTESHVKCNFFYNMHYNHKMSISQYSKTCDSVEFSHNSDIPIEFLETLISNRCKYIDYMTVHLVRLDEYKQKFHDFVRKNRLKYSIISDNENLYMFNIYHYDSNHSFTIRLKVDYKYGDEILFLGDCHFDQYEPLNQLGYKKVISIANEYIYRSYHMKIYDNNGLLFMGARYGCTFVIDYISNKYEFIKEIIHAYSILMKSHDRYRQESSKSPRFPIFIALSDPSMITIKISSFTGDTLITLNHILDVYELLAIAR